MSGVIIPRFWRIINIIAMYYVKNTILSGLVDTVLPHYCCSCGAIGSIFCDSCKYDIVSEPFDRCVVCLEPGGGICVRHRCLYRHAVVAGWRIDGLEKLIGASKFESVRAGCQAQAELLAAQLPHFVTSPVLVPVPTIRPHIRMRGYGHAELITVQLSKLTGYQTKQLIVRKSNTVQHGASRAQRRRQAAEAYALRGEISSEQTYIIVDDVYTTGASVDAVAKLLHDAGARDVWIAVTARQPREEDKHELLGR